MAVGGLAMGGPAVASAQQPAVPARTSLVFDGVTVIDVQTGHRLPTQRVVIAGNRIQAMGSGHTVQVPAGAQVVDARGKYLIPGLWDMHTHAWDSTALFYSLFIANGVTGIRDAGSDVPLDTLRRLRREILAGTRVGPPRQLLSGPALDQCSDLRIGPGYEHICMADTIEVRRVVDSLKSAGADMIKTYDLGQSLYFAVAAEARRVGIPFGGHIAPRTDITPIEASDSGASILDHVNTAGRLNSLCLGDTASASQCGRVAEAFRRNNTWWVPTFIVMGVDAEGLNKSHVSLAGDTLFRRWDEFVREFLGDSVRHLDLRYGPVGAAGELYHSSSVGTHLGGILTLVRRVGLPILAGTDVLMGNREMIPGFMLHTELAMYVAEGLTPLEALQTATLNPAKFLHATDSLGTVAPGKLADLVLLDADPLADIRNLTLIRAVVANGRYFDRATLDQLVTDGQVRLKQEFKVYIEWKLHKKHS